MKKNSVLIYVVDDDVSVCRALKLLLEAHGFKAETFTRAKDFLAFKHPKVPSCLVLDIRLPDIDGLVLQEEMVHQGISSYYLYYGAWRCSQERASDKSRRRGFFS